VQVKVNVEFACSAPVACDPLVAFAPAHAPAAVHVALFVADHVSMDVPPLVIELGAALKLMDGAGALTDTLAD
jgi:hypothetical protein